MQDMRRAGVPVRITKFDKPAAETAPTRERPGKLAFGCMKGEMEIRGEIVGPIGAFDDWKVDEP